MVLKGDGTVWATGFNECGQLGDGTRSDKSRFVEVFTGHEGGAAMGRLTGACIHDDDTYIDHG